MSRPPSLRTWYERNGRHHLVWRRTRDRWLVLTSEVMLQQTQVPRVEAAWPDFVAEFPTPEAAAAAGPGAVIRAWDRLGYPRRARNLHDAAVVVSRDGWPEDLRDLPGVGRYTAGAVRAQADGWDVPAVEVNIRRVLQRAVGRTLPEREAEAVMAEIGTPLRGRDRLLALMDLGAIQCRPREPRCGDCPLGRRCVTRGPLHGEARRRPARYAGSFRERRGRVLALLRRGPAPESTLDADALESLVVDGLARVHEGLASLP
jgi:A/G-specific adenine glycosylase